jgi:hypothetical protein
VKRPIVVTGSHRSGTTWVGRMLCLSGEAGYIHEPLNPVRAPSWMEEPPAYWYVYITGSNADLYTPMLDRVLGFRYPALRNLAKLRRPEHVGMYLSDLRRALPGRARTPRPLLKDPFALFSSEWFAERYGADIVITVRNPVAFVGSIKRMDWHFRFKTLLGQSALMNDWLRPFEAEMRRCRDTDVDVVEQGIVLWNVLHHVIAQLRDRHPSWSVVRHEDLSSDPIEGFADLYRSCGLRWDDAVAKEVGRYSSGGPSKELPMWRHGSVKRDSRSAVDTWRQRLTDEEVERVRAGTSEIAAAFYDD